MRETGDSSHPLADITNTTNQVILDRNERKKQRDKEHYASLSREQKDELNRKARERRAEKKKRDQENKHEEGATRCVDENGATRCVDENVSDGTNEQGTKQGINIHATDNVNEHTFLRTANSTDGDHGFDYYQNERGHGVNYYQNERGHGVNYYKNKHPFSPIYCCQEEKDKGQQCTDIQDGDEQFNFTHIQIDDNDGGADDPITAELQGGTETQSCSIDEENITPKERRRRRDSARWATMSPVSRALRNKRRRDSAVPKRLFKTPQEKVDRRRQSKRDFNKRVKEHKENTLHPDSIAMANPQWKPEFIFPPGDKPSDKMEIPEIGGTPLYFEPTVPEPPPQVETSEAFLSNTIHTSHLTPGLRNYQRKKRNQEFEASIGRNTKGTTGDNKNFASQPTQSCVVDNGITQTVPLGAGVAGDNITYIGTSNHDVVHERCTQTQPSVVEDADENVVFEEDEEEDEGYLFAGQGKIKCSIIFCMGWCFNSAWFVSIQSFRMLLRYGAISNQPFGA